MALPVGIGRHLILPLYIAAMVVVILALDFMVFRHRFWARLVVNIGTVLVFGAVYLRFLRPN